MTSTVFTAEKLQIGAGLSGYVAELGAAFLCSDLGITPEPRADHAQYNIAHWLKILKDDNKTVFTAAAKASEAANRLIGHERNAPWAAAFGDRLSSATVSMLLNPALSYRSIDPRVE